MTDDLGKRIREARLARGWSQEHLAEQVKTTQSTIERIENGGSLRSRFRHEVASVLEIASLAESSPRRKEGQRPPPEILGARDLPVFAAVEGGPGEMMVFSTDPHELIPRPWFARDPEAFGVYLAGESMEPVYEAGQIIIVSPRAPLVKGKDAVFTAEPVGGDFRASLKRYRGQTEDAWLAKQFNPEMDLKFDRATWRKAFRVLGRFDG